LYIEPCCEALPGQNGNRGHSVIKLEFDEKAYQEYLTKRDYPSNTRIRPKGVSLMDVLLEEQERMNETEEGKRLFDLIAAL
jgi:hypothetical protein